MRIAVLYSYAPQAGIIEGFKKLGYDVKSYFYGINEVALKQRIEWKIFKTQEKFLTKNFNFQIGILFSEHEKINFDLLLIIKGKKITKKSRENLMMMNKTYKVLWTTDSVIRFPHQLSVKNLVDKVYVQDGEDVELVKDSEWLPLGFDDDLYKPSKEKEIDILLFGNCDERYYAKRIAYFLEASKLGTKFNMKFVGSKLNKKAKGILLKRNVSISNKVNFTEFTKLISKSRIALNIHQDDGGKAINPLFFAIPGCGTIQVTDNKEYYKMWLNEGLEYFPVERNELNKKLQCILSDYNIFLLSDKGIKAVNDRFSYKSIAKKIILDNE